MMRVLIPFAIVGALHLLEQDVAAGILAAWLLIFWTSYALAHAGDRERL